MLKRYSVLVEGNTLALFANNERKEERKKENRRKRIKIIKGGKGKDGESWKLKLLS